MQHAAYLLLVDDNAALRDALETVLTIKGYAVKSFKNGRQALGYMKYKKPPPTLVITDLCMPEVDGWTLRNHMLNDPELATVPVAVMSAVVPGQDEQPLYAAAYLQKPVQLSSVLSVVKQFVSPVASHC